MTEQEFRERLKRAARNEGMTPERQMQVLARREGDEHKVRNWHKAKCILVIALLMATGVTGAVAGGWSLVDWQGEPLPSVETAPPYMNSLDVNFKEPEKGQIITLVSLKPPEGENILGIVSRRDNSDSYASSEAELQAWVEAELDGFLPWPEMIPNEYNQMKMGRVHYAVDEYGEFELVRQELTEDGNFLRTYFELPTNHCYMDNYSLHLLNDEGQELTIKVSLSSMKRKGFFIVDDESSPVVLDVEGFDQAIAIVSPQQSKVALRKDTDYAIHYKYVEGDVDNEKREIISYYDCLEIEIIGQGSPADLLAIFGLEVQ